MRHQVCEQTVGTGNIMTGGWSSVGPKHTDYKVHWPLVLSVTMFVAWSVCFASGGWTQVCEAV
jgi:hypothetical protein